MDRRLRIHLAGRTEPFYCGSAFGNAHGIGRRNHQRPNPDEGRGHAHGIGRVTHTGRQHLCRSGNHIWRVDAGDRRSQPGRMRERGGKRRRGRAHLHGQQRLTTNRIEPERSHWRGHGNNHRGRNLQLLHQGSRRIWRLGDTELSDRRRISSVDHCARVREPAVCCHRTVLCADINGIGRQRVRLCLDRFRFVQRVHFFSKRRNRYHQRTRHVHGTVNFTASVKDGEGDVSSTLSYSIPVYSPLSLPTSNPPTLGWATLSLPYTGTVVGSGGSGNYAWTVTGLPSDNLSYSTNGGTLTLTGTPGTATTVSFTAKLTDTTTNLTVGPYTYTVPVYATVTLPSPNPASLGPGDAGINYIGTITAAGGSGNYSWTVTGLSDGLSSSPSGGTLTISGTPRRFRNSFVQRLSQRQFHQHHRGAVHIYHHGVQRAGASRTRPGFTSLHRILGTGLYRNNRRIRWQRYLFLAGNGAFRQSGSKPQRRNAYRERHTGSNPCNCHLQRKAHRHGNELLYYPDRIQHCYRHTAAGGPAHSEPRFLAVRSHQPALHGIYRRVGRRHAVYLVGKRRLDPKQRHGRAHCRQHHGLKQRHQRAF